jgi:hypothetical protein
MITEAQPRLSWGNSLPKRIWVPHLREAKVGIGAAGQRNLLASKPPIGPQVEGRQRHRRAGRKSSLAETPKSPANSPCQGVRVSA